MRGLVLVLPILLATYRADAAPGADAAAEASRGEQIFAHGVSPSGDTITAYVGAESVALPASAVPCGSCHGEDGRGRREGGVVPSDITWSHLTKSYGHRHDYGRTHPAFDSESAIAAIADGVDPAGNRLSDVMPRYDMSKDDMSALLAYIQQLESRTHPGLTDESIRLGTVLPLTGPAAPLGETLRALLTAFVDELNSKGGLHGRRVELEVLPLGDTRMTALAHVEDALEKGELFALLSPYAADIEAELNELVERHRVPLIAPLTPRPLAGSHLSRYTFNLLADRGRQVQALVDFAAEKAEDARMIAMVAGPDGEEFVSLAAAANATADKHGWPELRSFSYAPGELDADRLATSLSVAGSQALFFLGSPAELSEVLATASRAGQAPWVFVLADAVTPSLFEAPAAFNERVFIAYPTLPSDVTEKGREALGRLIQAHSLSMQFLSAQASAYAAGTVAIEALKRAGRDLSQEKFVDALESLDRFETGLTPPVTFTLNQHVGASGSYVLRLELTEKRYSPIGKWRNLP